MATIADLAPPTTNSTTHAPPTEQRPGTRLRHIGTATRKGKHIRMAIDGPTGSGKTYSALLIATHIASVADRVLMIDTEDGSAGLYAPQFGGFQHLIWEPPFDPRELYQHIRELGGEFDVIVVDSLTHFWNEEGGTLDIVDHSAKTRFGGNRYAGWQDGDAAQRQLVASIKRAKCHVIATMRSKMEYVQNDGKVEKVGMAPIQRDGLEYELDVIVDMDLGHSMNVSKTRFSALSGRSFPPGKTEDVANALMVELEEAEPMATDDQIEEIKRLARLVPDADRPRVTALAREMFGSVARLTISTGDQCIAWYEAEVEALLATDEDE